MDKTIIKAVISVIILLTVQGCVSIFWFALRTLTNASFIYIVL